MPSTNTKAYVLRTQSKEELHATLKELRTELADLRVKKTTGGTGGGIHNVRKSIARCLTVLNHTQRAKLAEEFKGKKYKPLQLRQKKTRAIRRRLTHHELALKTLKQTKKDTHFGKRKYAIKA